MTARAFTHPQTVSRGLRTSNRFWVYAPLVAAIAFRLASPSTANLSYLLLAAYALFGPSHALRALLLSWLFTMINPGIAPEASVGSAGRYAILFAAALSAFAHSGILSPSLRIGRFTLATLALGIFLIGHSLLFSPIVDVSVLKAVSWTVAMATIVSIWTGLSPEKRRQVERDLFGALTMVGLVSLPLIVSPLGYVRNEVGFQGILNHPQVFGQAMALLGVWAAAGVFVICRPAWWALPLVGLSAALVLLSEARTAGLAMLGGLILSMPLAPLFANRSIMRMVPLLRNPVFWIVACMMLVAALIFAPFLLAMAQSFITKSGRANVEGLADAFLVSRAVLFEPMLDNIRQHPLTGIGFGIASDPSAMIVQRDALLGLPLGAPIEKGTVPIMVLEELGIFGAAAVGLWILALLRGCAKGGLVPFSVCMTVLLLNLGEATLFSPGGHGLLMLILLGWAYGTGKNRDRMKHV